MQGAQDDGDGDDDDVSAQGATVMPRTTTVTRDTYERCCCTGATVVSPSIKERLQILKAELLNQSAELDRCCVRTNET